MRNSVFIILLLSLYINTTAQISNKAVSATVHKANTNSFLNRLLQKQSATNGTAAKTTATIRERLIGESDYGSTSIADSMSLTYSGGRGSTFSLQFISYGAAFGPGFLTIDGGSIFGYSNSDGLTLINNLVFALSDVTKTWTMNPTTFTLDLMGTETRNYDAKNNLLDDAYEGVPGIVWQRDVCTYNSLSAVTSTLELVADPGTGGLPWDSSARDIFTYNGSNQLAIDSQSSYNITTLSWQPAYKYVYNYDGAKNMVLAQSYSWQPGWQLVEAYTMTYYSSTNYLKTFEDDNYDPTAIVAYQDSFGYTTGYSYWTYDRHKEYSTGTLTDMTIDTKHINLLGLPDTISSYDYFSGGTPVSDQWGVFVYNSFHDPVTLTSYANASIGSPSVLESKTFYYYETYDATGVPALISHNDNISIYPNPATNTVYINRPGFIKNTTATITILNTAGQKITTDTRPWQNETEQISLEDLPSGTYFITIQDNNSNLLHTQQIEKL